MPATKPTRAPRGGPPRTASARAWRRLAALAALLVLAGPAACAKRPGDLVSAAPESAETSLAVAPPSAPQEAAGHGERAAPDRDDGAADALTLTDYERLLGEQEQRLANLGAAGPAREAERATRSPSGGELAGAGGGDATAAEPPPPTSPRAKPSRAPTSTPTAGKSAAAKTRKKEAANDEADACLMICEIAATTCELEQKICDLASRHPQEARYAQVCARAHDDCQLASRTCEACAA